MKALSLPQLCALVITGAGSLAFVLPCVAGDKIIVSEEKTHADPSKDRIGNDLFKTRLKLEQSPFDSGILGMPTIPRLNPLSRSEERRLKHKEAEQREWMFLNPGELQRKDEEESTFGVRRSPLDDLDKNDNRRNYTFYRIGEPKDGSSPRLPGELRSPKQQQTDAKEAAQQQQRNRDQAEEETRRENRKFDLGGSDGQLSAHTASELNFKNLFDPAQKESLSGDSAAKADFSLRSLMGTTLPRSKDQEARMNDFKQLINTPSQPQGSFGVASPPSFSQPSGGSAPGFTTRPPEPASSRPNDLFNQSPSSINSVPGYPNTPGLPTFNNNPGYNPSPFQRQMPAAPDTSKNWMKPIEPQRRKF